MIYLPIFFICITGGECDFVFAKPVPTREICETMNAEYELRPKQSLQTSGLAQGPHQSSGF